MTLPCPRCAAPLAPPLPGGEASTTCLACGHTMSAAYLAETIELGTWHAWAGQRLTWLHDRLVAGDLPAEGEGPAPMPPSADRHRGTAAPASTAPAGLMLPAPPARPPASAGSLLLAAGAFLLVIAGIAFLAFTWDLLGPFGQIAVLLLLGAAALAATDRLLARLRGTATALGVVGTLLVTIAAIGARTLGPDLIGAGASLLVAVAIVTALCVAAVWLRPRTTPIGELAGVAGAVSLLVLLATAPVDGALPLSEPWTWWVWLTTGAGAVALLGLSDRARLSAWPWIAAASLVVSAISLAVVVQETTENATVGAVEPVVAALALLIASVGVALLLRWTAHVWPVTVAALAVWGLALVIAWGSGVSTPEARPWAALVLAAVGAVALVPALLVVGPTGLRRAVSLIGVSAVGAAVGVAVAPWLDPLLNYLTVESWAGQAWPPWRGLAAGLAFVALLLASVAFTPRAIGNTRAVNGAPTQPGPLLAFAPLVPPAVALVTWLIASSSDLGEATTGRGRYLDPYQPQPTPDAFQHQVALAMTVFACGLLVMVLLRRIPALSVWAVPFLTVPAALLDLSTRSLDSTAEPEVYGLALGIPTLVASIGWWWVRRPEHTPTWQTVAPPFVLAVAPSTLALLDDTTDRWFLDESSTTAYQVRLVTLLTIGVGAAVVGAWQRWGGLFFPGLGLTLIVAGIELIDLGRFLPQWLSFAIAGAVLIAAGARWEWVRQRGRVGATWVRSLT